MFTTPLPINDPILGYAPGSPEKAALKAKLAELGSSVLDIPLVIGGKEVRTGKTIDVTSPHDHRKVLAKVHQAGPAEVKAAVESAVEAQKWWQHTKWEDRASIFLKAADLLAGPYRSTVVGATMWGQSKTAHQAEIDAACELIDFWRFNVHYAERLYQEQPISDKGMWNRLDHRPLEGFIYAITPFNFTAIGGNLPTAPAMLGNVAVWKPAATASVSNWFVYKVLLEAGLPPGVINFVPGPASTISDLLLNDSRLAGIHFTGSTEVFQSLWQGVAKNLPNYKGYPRLVGETGGKDFVVAHASADADALAVALVRGAFEYQGQKCSAASRAYIPSNLWPRVQERMLAALAEIKMGDVGDFRNFLGAVIDKKAFDRIKGYLDEARTKPGVTFVAGGKCDDSKGWFIEPTILKVEDPKYRTMCEEIFGPVLTVHVYPEAKWEETLALVDSTSPYALTGAVFAQDRAAQDVANRALRNAAGNYYINDKPTGAVVGQQPFGGARASGTNDKAGSILNLIRWISPRLMKENFVPPHDWKYPYLGAE
jgi:1-pyrroline-5-carboxylate dehydrogenase